MFDKNDIEIEEKPKKKRKLSGFQQSLLGGVIGALALFVVLQTSGMLSLTINTPSTNTPENVTINASTEDATLAGAVARKALPSVVSINMQTKNSAGVGSGVILDKEGNILTNYHVVDGAQVLSVNIKDQSYDATVVGTDPSSDLAVIKVELNGAKVVPIEVGNSDDLHVGDWVMSIGSPFGLDQSVSTGIVSSLYRNTMLPSYSGNTIYTNLIQTDAAINPGNSGGALVNDKGELIGINSIIESASGSSSGVGFAIPGNFAVEVAKTIISGEDVLHPYIGLTLQTVTADVARNNHLAVNQGAYVVDVVDGGPAAEAGIKKGDIIIEVDGEAITSADSLILSARSHKIGQEVSVKYVRGSAVKDCQVTFGSDEALQKQKDENSSQLTLRDLLEQWNNNN